MMQGQGTSPACWTPIGLQVSEHCGRPHLRLRNTTCTLLYRTGCGSKGIPLQPVGSIKLCCLANVAVPGLASHTFIHVVQQL
jgi:hypothetical protein